MKQLACSIGIPCLLLVRVATGQEIGVPASTDSVAVGVSMSVDSITVGERFLVSLKAVHDYVAPPTFPEPNTMGTPGVLPLGDLEVLRVHARGHIVQNGTRADSIVYEVTTFALDSARVGPVPVLFAAGEDTIAVRTEVTWLPVIALVPEDAEGPKDLAPLVDFPRARWPYVVTGIVLLLVLLTMVYLLRRRKRAEDPPAFAPPPIPPDREAFDRLRALTQVDLTNEEEVEPFYDELSGLLRTYVARRLHVHALEMTTSEMTHEMRNRDVPDEETTSRLRNVLVACDYVKFADARPAAKQGGMLIATSETIIHAVEALLRSQETEPAEATPQETAPPEATPTEAREIRKEPDHAIRTP